VGWIFEIVGIILVICGNVRGAYHKDKMPKLFVRLSLTLAGVGLMIVGLHYVGILSL
jgi:hypothetical protein